jgi:oligoribonuclease NrnB/cAMP/cGMP phosphodiesterase (DHH superfamily)
MEKIMLLNNETICISHRKSDTFWCPDGIVSAYIMNVAFDNPVFMFGTYYKDDEILEHVGINNYIYFTDYSMSVENMNDLAKSNNVLVLDHHKTAKENLSRVSSSIEKYFDMGKSGARLTWEHFYGKEVPPFVLYIEDGDLYKFSLPYAKIVCAGIYTLMEYNTSMEEVFHSIADVINLTEEQLIEKFVPIGEEALIKRQRRVETYTENAYPQTIKGNKVLVVEFQEKDTDLVSTIGYRLYTDNPEIAFAVMVNIQPDVCHISFRSSGFDCEPIARSFGGGGHPQACGCRVNNLNELFDS